MTNQLVLLPPPTADASPCATRWSIDDHTRAVGRAGLAQARATLRAARVRSLDRDAHAANAA
jgi:hypothetical protein